LEFNVPFQHKYGYIRDDVEEVCTQPIAVYILFTYFAFIAVTPAALTLVYRPFGHFLTLTLHRVSKNVPPLTCYNFDAHEWILIFFGRNVTNKVGNQKALYILCHLK